MKQLVHFWPMCCWFCFQVDFLNQDQVKVVQVCKLMWLKKYSNASLVLKRKQFNDELLREEMVNQTFFEHGNIRGAWSLFSACSILWHFLTVSFPLIYANEYFCNLRTQHSNNRTSKYNWKLKLARIGAAFLI